MANTAHQKDSSEYIVVYLDELSDGTQRLEISLDKSDRILRQIGRAHV